MRYYSCIIIWIIYVGYARWGVEKWIPCTRKAQANIRVLLAMVYISSAKVIHSSSWDFLITQTFYLFISFITALVQSTYDWNICILVVSHFTSLLLASNGASSQCQQ